MTDKIKKKLAIEDPWFVALYKLCRPNVGPFTVEGVEGFFDFVTYEFMYKEIPNGEDPCGYYMAYYNDGPRQSDIHIRIDFRPLLEKVEIKDRTKPSGKKRDDYEEIKAKALSIMLSLCTKLKEENNGRDS